MDWEIVHHHVPTGTKTIVTNINDKDYDDFYPSISQKGGCSCFKQISITSNNQIFVAKLVDRLLNLNYLIYANY